MLTTLWCDIYITHYYLAAQHGLPLNFNSLNNNTPMLMYFTSHIFIL